MKPKKLSPPEEKKFILYANIDSNINFENRSNKEYGSWSRSWTCNLNTISKIELSGYGVEWINVPENVYNAPKIGAIIIKYSTGDTFGREDGRLCVGLITHKALILKKGLEVLNNIEWNNIRDDLEEMNSLRQPEELNIRNNVFK